MIRSIVVLQIEDKEIFGQVYERMMSLPASAGFSRYTFEEIKEIAQQSNQILGAGESRWFQWKSQFTLEEWNLVSSVLNQSEDRHEKIKQRCRISNERCTRYLRDLTGVHKQEAALAENYKALQSARSSVGMEGKNVADSLDRRFQEIEGVGSVRVQQG